MSKMESKSESRLSPVGIAETRRFGDVEIGVYAKAQVVADVVGV